MGQGARRRGEAVKLPRTKAVHNLKKLIQRGLNRLGYDIRKVEPRSQAVVHELSLPKVPLTAILNESVPIKVLEPEPANGNIILLELTVLNGLVARLKPSSLFEIGTFDGRTTLNLAANAAPGARVYTLDLPEAEMNQTVYPLDAYEGGYIQKAVSGQRFHQTRWQEQIEQFYGDSATFDFQPYHGKMGFVFIDGSHDYNPFWMGVVKYLEELHATGGIFSGMRHVAGTSLVVLPIGTSLES